MMLDQWRAASPFVPTPERVLDVVAHMYDTTVEQLLGPSRCQPLARQRQIACWLMRDQLNLSFPQIASAVGRQDHTTAIHAVRVIDEKLTGDVRLAAQIRTLQGLIRGESHRVA